MTAYLDYSESVALRFQAPRWNRVLRMQAQAVDPMQTWLVVIEIVGGIGALIAAATGWLTYLHSVRSKHAMDEQNERMEFRRALERRFQQGNDDIESLTTQFHGLELELARNYITRADVLLAVERINTRMEASVSSVNGKLDAQSRDLMEKVDRLV